MIEILLIALSLSMDAFAVSVSSAACSKGLSRMHMFRAAATFGLFQFIMPLAGWLLGTTFSGMIKAFDHWIAFGLLAFVGGKMLLEAIEEFREPAETCPAPGSKKERGLDVCDVRVLLVLALATSIDALAVGISFSVIGQPAFVPSLVIGLVTCIVCSVGFLFGRKIGSWLGRWAQLAGGLVLVGIGIRILAGHFAGGI